MESWTAATAGIADLEGNDHPASPRQRQPFPRLGLRQRRAPFLRAGVGEVAQEPAHARPGGGRIGEDGPEEAGGHMVRGQHPRGWIGRRDPSIPCVTSRPRRRLRSLPSRTCPNKPGRTPTRFACGWLRELDMPPKSSLARVCGVSHVCCRYCLVPALPGNAPTLRLIGSAPHMEESCELTVCLFWLLWRY